MKYKVSLFDPADGRYCGIATIKEVILTGQRQVLLASNLSGKSLGKLVAEDDRQRRYTIKSDGSWYNLHPMQEK